MSKYIIIATLFLGLACQRETQEEVVTEEKMAAYPEIISLNSGLTEGLETGNIEDKIVFESISSRGRVMIPYNQIQSIYPKIGGFISKMNVLPGTKVQKGDVLAYIEHQDYIDLQSFYLETKNEFEYLEKEFERQKLLHQGNANALKTLEKTNAEYLKTKTNLNSLKQKLLMVGIDPSEISEDHIISKVPIKTPINGYLNDFTTNVGMFVKGEQELFKILNYEHLHVDLEVFERDAQKIHEGLAVDFKLSGSDKTYHAYVNQIGKEVDPETKTLTIHCDLDESYDFLRQDMQLLAKIHLSQDTLSSIPVKAVLKGEEDNFVYILSKDQVKLIKIDIKEWNDDYVILSDKNNAILENQKIVFNPQKLLEV